MSSIEIHDIREHGLKLIGPDDPGFHALAEGIRNTAMFPPPDPITEDAAVLVNDSGQPIITLTYIWELRDASERKHTAVHSNLGSSRQFDALAGRDEVRPDRFSFIHPGSKRLITTSGMFGDNSDVLPPEPQQSGVVGSRSGGSGRGRDSQPISLQLDFAVLANGLCIGPDTLGTFQGLSQELEEQRRLSEEILDGLRADLTRGQLFDKLRPLTSRDRFEPPAPSARHRPRLLSMFAQSAIHQLINIPDEHLIAQFERTASPSRLQLRRPQNK